MARKYNFEYRHTRLTTLYNAGIYRFFQKEDLFTHFVGSLVVAGILDSTLSIMTVVAKQKTV
jgi:hypothetical protein